MKTKKIILLGTGKLSKALVKGFVLSGEAPSEILVVGRSNKEKIFYENIGVSYSLDFEDVGEVQFLIIAVTPDGAASVLRKIKTSNIYSQRIISFVSGLSMKKIAEVLNVKSGSVAVATCNTNIAYGSGVVCLLDNASKEVKSFLSVLGKLLYVEDEQLLLLCVVIVGSMSSFDLKALWLCYSEVKHHTSFKSWLICLSKFLHTKTSQVYMNSRFKNIFTYLKSKSLALSKLNNYEGFDCNLHATETLLSSCNTLLKMKNSLSLDEGALDVLIKTVVTKGGCTEKGINNIDSVETLKSSEKIFEIFNSVYSRAKLFPKDVNSSFLDLK